MNCSEVNKHLIFYLEGSLSRDLSRQIGEHLGKCTGCNEFAEVMRGSLSVLENEKRIQPNPGFYGRVIRRMESEKPLTARLYRRIVQFAAAAAVIIFGIFCGINIAKFTTDYISYYEVELSDEFYYLNDIYQEPIENFFLLNVRGNE